MRLTDCLGRRVLDTSTATTSGKLDRVLVDPRARRVVGVRVKRKGDGYVVWDALTAFGPDAVTIPGEQAFTAGDPGLEALAGKRGTLVGKRVLTDAGDLAGTVEDVEFDPATGELTSLSTSDGEVAAERLRGVGTWAVVIAR